MGMGMSACFTDAIDNEKLYKLFPAEHDNLMIELGKAYENKDKSAEKLADVRPQTSGELLDEFAEAACNDACGRDDLDERFAGAKKALDKLARAFKRKYGLVLTLCYHDPDDGDRYDEVSGAYWDMDGLYVLSKGARKLGKGNFERKFFTHFG